jgi:hypothetical protein
MSDICLIYRTLQSPMIGYLIIPTCRPVRYKHKSKWNTISCSSTSIYLGTTSNNIKLINQKENEKTTRLRFTIAFLESQRNFQVSYFINAEYSIYLEDSVNYIKLWNWIIRETFVSCLVPSYNKKQE